MGDEQFRSDEDAMKTRVKAVKKREPGENTHAQRRIRNLEWRGSKSGSKTCVEDMEAWDYVSQFGHRKDALFEREEEIRVKKWLNVIELGWLKRFARKNVPKEV